MIGEYPSIALVGLPGAGKSTVARHLGRRISVPVLDTDNFIEQRSGCSIKTFFDREGEARFRDLEEEIIDELTSGEARVLSTGGGSVLRAINRDRLRSRCKVIYLRSAPEDVYRRLRNDQTRPLLQVADPLQRLRDLFSERDPLYRETAHFVIETGRPSVSTLVNMVMMQLELAGVTVSAVADR